MPHNCHIQLANAFKFKLKKSIYEEANSLGYLFIYVQDQLRFIMQKRKDTDLSFNVQIEKSPMFLINPDSTHFWLGLA